MSPAVNSLSHILDWAKTDDVYFISFSRFLRLKLGEKKLGLTHPWYRLFLNSEEHQNQNFQWNLKFCDFLKKNFFWSIFVAMVLRRCYVSCLIVAFSSSLLLCAQAFQAKNIPELIQARLINICFIFLHRNRVSLIIEGSTEKVSQLKCV